MSVITAKGSEARESAVKDSIDPNDIRISLKDGESHKVRILSPEDYVEYNAVGDFNNGIYVQPVTETSPLLKAHKEGGTKFKDMYPRKRYAFAFGSLENGQLMFFDGSRNQAKALIATIEEYKDDLGDYAFNLSRTGKQTATTYSLNPVLKMKDDEKKAFESFDDTEVELSFYEQILQPNSDDFVVKLLSEIDPSIVDLFPDIDLSVFNEDGTKNTVDKVDDDLDIDGADLPF